MAVLWPAQNYTASSFLRNTTPVCRRADAHHDACKCRKWSRWWPRTRYFVFVTAVNSLMICLCIFIQITNVADGQLDMQNGRGKDERAFHGLWGSAGLKMPINTHFFRWAILTGKVVSDSEWVSGPSIGIISNSWTSFICGA